MARMVDTEPDFWKQILMNDEAHFTLSGGVNKQNCRFWGTENPHEIHETRFHDQKLTVWAGVCAKTIIGPYFFRENEIVDGNRYRWMLVYYVCPQMREKGLDGYILVSTRRCAMPHCKLNNLVSATEIPWTSVIKKR